MVALERPEVELFIRANHIEIHNDQRSRVVVTDELKEEFDEFWRRHENTPLQGTPSVFLTELTISKKKKRT